jgi:DNA-directed RNA polymerase specialized sigma24 family protein
MARLPPGQRLLLQLRYEQELTLAEVARLAGLPDLNRANRQIQAALAELARLLEDPGPG